MIRAVAIDDEPLALHVIKTFCADFDFIDLQRTFTKPTEALKHLRKSPADLLFLDIRMPAMSGINLLKAMSQDTMIIFTTAYSDHAVESYELNAIDYLLKPINRQRFAQAVHKAEEYFRYSHGIGNQPQKDIFVRADFKLVKIPLADIRYIEALGDYLKFFIAEREKVVVRMTMKEVLEHLPERSFFRAHRSFIVPKQGILSVGNKTIRIAEKEIPIGSSYQKDFLGWIEQ